MVENSRYDFVEEALPFVLYNPNVGSKYWSLAHKITLLWSIEFEINEETREFLKSLEGPIGVLSVAGMYRSGKSYLLNRCLLNRSRGFDVGHTINACTKVSILAILAIYSSTAIMDSDFILILIYRVFGSGASQSMDSRLMVNQSKCWFLILKASVRRMKSKTTMFVFSLSPFSSHPTSSITASNRLMRQSSTTWVSLSTWRRIYKSKQVAGTTTQTPKSTLSTSPLSCGSWGTLRSS